MSNKNPNPATRFKKGQVANPKGRPVGSFSLTTKIKELLMDDDGKVGDALKKAIVLRAIGKSDTLAKEIWDRIDGSVQQNTNLTGEIQIEHVKGKKSAEQLKQSIFKRLQK